jgi:predicted dinucleotide-binding enzyme
VTPFAGLLLGIFEAPRSVGCAIQEAVSLLGDDAEGARQRFEALAEAQIRAALDAGFLRFSQGIESLTKPLLALPPAVVAVAG